MIPDFNQHGLLPAGIHLANPEEFKERFVVFDRSDRRFRLFDGLHDLLREAQKVDCVKRILVVGSFISATAEPNDFDCLLLLDKSIVDRPMLPFEYRLVSRRMAKKAFGGDVMTAVEDSSAARELLEFFQTTREGRRTGIVEIER